MRGNMVWLFMILLLVPMAIGAGCTCDQTDRQPHKGFTGFTNPEDLSRVYLKSIEDKDIEALKTLFLTPSDLKNLSINKASKQHWMGYFSHNKRLFLNKNKDLLGKKLTFLSFRPGTEFKLKPGVSIFRGGQIIAEQPDKKRVTLELEFIIRINSSWKLLFLRYLNPKANVGQGPTVYKDGEKPAMAIPGPKPDMEIKVKMIDTPPQGEQPPATDAPAPAQDDSEQSLEELKKLFGQ